MQAGALTHKALNLIQTTGQPALSQACKNILKNQYDQGTVCEALHYYANEVLPRVLPIFPALIQLSAKTAGSIPKNTQSVAASMLLITASGDIHDDIVDNSKKKFGRKTVVGKYGKTVALLAGDLLLVEGSTALQKECQHLPSERRNRLAELVNTAMHKIVIAEALEAMLWRKEDVSPQELFEVFSLKAGVAELHCQIGGLIADANQNTLDALAHYGRTIGILATLKEEYVDMTSPTELWHRIKHELPPYPMLYALENNAVKREVEALTKKAVFSIKGTQKISKAVFGCQNVKAAADEFRELGRRELANNPLFKHNGSGELALLLEALSFELTLV